jgi:hypothetical protein
MDLFGVFIPMGPLRDRVKEGTIAFPMLQDKADLDWIAALANPRRFHIDNAGSSYCFFPGWWGLLFVMAVITIAKDNYPLSRPKKVVLLNLTDTQPGVDGEI